MAKSDFENPETEIKSEAALRKMLSRVEEVEPRDINYAAGLAEGRYPIKVGEVKELLEEALADRLRNEADTVRMDPSGTIRVRGLATSATPPEERWVNAPEIRRPERQEDEGLPRGMHRIKPGRPGGGGGRTEL